MSISADPLYSNQRSSESCTACYVLKNGTQSLISNGTTWIYDDVDSTTAIQKAIDMAARSKGQVIVLPGSYEVTSKLNFTESTKLRGGGGGTILNFSSIGERPIIGMGPNSNLENMVLAGPAKTYDTIQKEAENITSPYRMPLSRILTGHTEDLPKDFTQEIQLSDNSVIRNISIQNLGYGIETGGTKNVTIENVKCNGLHSKNDWAACVHASKGTNNLKIHNLSVTNSNRGVEVEEGASNVLVENAYFENIHNFAGTGHESWSLDAHTHSGKAVPSNVLFRNIVMKNSYSHTTVLAYANSPPSNYSYAELPRNITFHNITLISPISPWHINGQDVLLENISIINSTNTIFIVYNQSKDIVLANITAEPFFQNEYLAISDLTEENIQNLTIGGARSFMHHARHGQR
jgi:hypothetical protein